MQDLDGYGKRKFFLKINKVGNKGFIPLFAFKLLNAVLIYISYASTFSFLPILARDFGASNLTLSVLVSMNIAVSVLGNLLIVQLARRLEGRWVIALGFSLSITGLALAWLSASLTWIFAAQIMIGLGNGVAYPTLMGSTIAYVAGEQRSTAMGLHQAVYAIGMFAGPWLSGILAEAIGIRPMFGITAFAALILGFLGTRIPMALLDGHTLIEAGFISWRGGFYPVGDPLMRPFRV